MSIFCYKANEHMPTYRNEQFGFEIDLPDGWTRTFGFFRIPVILSNAINQANILEEFSYAHKEFLNIVVERMQPEIPPDINEMIFLLRAQEMHYTDLRFGRIAVCGRSHACVCYEMNRKGWLKKYMIVLNGFGYALTASCPLEHKSAVVEETWDSIASSLRLFVPIDNSIITFNNSPQVQHTIEKLRQELKRHLDARKRP